MESLPLFDSSSFSFSDGKGSHPYHILLCPKCKGNYLHHRKVEDNFKSDDINMYFYCEFCGEGSDGKTRLNIKQYKGQTMVEWQRLGVMV